MVIHDNYESEKRFRSAFVPNTKGLFVFLFSNLNSDLENISLNNIDCQTNLSINYNMNNITDNNFHLLEASPNDIGTHEGFTLEGGYAFWVMD